MAAEVATIKSSINKRAYVGTIGTKTETGFDLSNLKKETRNVVVTAETTIKKGATELTLKDLKSGDFVIAMGDADAKNNMTAKRILVIDRGAEDKRKTIIFTVTKTGTTSLGVENLKKETWSVRLSTDTRYSIKTKLADLAVGDKIAVIGTTASIPSTFNALRIHKLSK
ncbi:MAG: DUF5666 domain-containing protein [Patescibacteria group bacterium]